MSRRRRSTGSVALALVFVVGSVLAPVDAHHGSIEAYDFSYRPVTLKGLSTNPTNPARDHPIRWTNTGNTDHRMMAQPQVIAFDSGHLDPGETSSATRLKFAATYKYVCIFHGGMDGRIKVRPALYEPGAPGNYAVTIRLGEKAILRLANGELPNNRVMDVQRKRGSGTWTTIRTGVIKQRIYVGAGKEGSYRFRTRVRTDAGARTSWSPASKVLKLT